jgi:23S rRNA (uridine2552-2'-O)-methyltransferase
MKKQLLIAAVAATMTATTMADISISGAAQVNWTNTDTQNADSVNTVTHDMDLKITGKSGQVIASDILPIEEINGVNFIQGDFTEQSVYDELMNLIKGSSIDIVLSDMEPNMSGQLSVDQPKSMYLADLAIDFALKILSRNGHFIVKVFQGDGFDEYVKKSRSSFRKVSIIKPKASRPRSKEVYLLASQLK